MQLYINLIELFMNLCLWALQTAQDIQDSGIGRFIQINIVNFVFVCALTAWSASCENAVIVVVE